MYSYTSTLRIIQMRLANFEFYPACIFNFYDFHKVSKRFNMHRMCQIQPSTSAAGRVHANDVGVCCGGGRGRHFDALIRRDNV